MQQLVDKASGTTSDIVGTAQAMITFQCGDDKLWEPALKMASAQDHLARSFHRLSAVNGIAPQVLITCCNMCKIGLQVAMIWFFYMQMQ